MIELTKPFEVGKAYKRVDGTTVICTQLNNKLKGYETAQFSDFVERHEAVMVMYRDDSKTMDFIMRTDADWDTSAKSGYRYNRAEDRGRGTGGKWDSYSVIPEPRDAEHVHELFAHLKRSFGE